VAKYTEKRRCLLVILRLKLQNLKLVKRRIIAHRVGKGKVIAFSDDVNFSGVMARH